MKEKDSLLKKSLDILEKLWGIPYRWKHEWDRWGHDHKEGEGHTPFVNYFTKAKRFQYDPYWENSDQAGIGMQETIITDGFYPMPTDKVILDVGAGNGDLMKYLTQDKTNTVIGMDIGLHGQKTFWKEKRYKYSTLLYMDVSSDRFPFPDDVFDLVVFTEIVEHLGNPCHTLMEIKRVLKENGELIITFPEVEDQHGYWGGNHSFIYPGLFARKYFRRFMIQLFFKQLKYKENGGTGKYLFRNIKEGFINPYAMAKGDWQGNLVYKDIRNKYEDMEADWKDFSKEEIEEKSKENT
jgi:ubiquinone/menaquinone biosynthesis C-methylase UbiE